ncbi:MAG TPA: single-stranded-DNA-specific exonuclease RecJ [Anaerolineaceae bacterium]|jgi:single-stranded-DNA-specific exonuclease
MPSRIWKTQLTIDVPAEVLAAAGGSRLVAEVLCRRGISGAAQARAFLDPVAYRPAPASDLPGLDGAVEYLVQAIQAQKSICVWGDFDVDGQTSTTILVSSLRDLGGRVNYHIPVRGPETHGIGLAALGKVIDAGAEVLLTCDTGISAVDAVEAAHSRNVGVVITDHHELPEQLPAAEHIVSSRLAPPGHPLGTLPGVGVAYKLAEALYERMSRPGEAEQYTDLAVMGIIADLAELYGDARYLAMLGLRRLRLNQRVGLQQMLQLAELDAAHLTEEHIGFVLAPRLNALGRLADSNPSVELLTTPDGVRARILAQQLEALNARRKMLTDQVYQAALGQIEREPGLLDHPALVLGHPAWPAGVVGIVASRLVERYERPVILLVTPQGEAARGSARSVDGCDITGAIASQAHLLLGYGGHPMAAGLSLDPAHIPEFQRGLDRAVAAMLAGAPPAADLSIEADLPLADLTLESVGDLERLAPFGPGNPALVFASRNMAIRSTSPVGRGGEHLLVTVENDQGQTNRVIWWQGGGERLPEGRFDLAYKARTSNYKGKLDVQVEWVDAQMVQAVDLGGGRPGETARENLDLRMRPRPELELAKWMAKGSLSVWLEDSPESGVDGVHRLDLAPAKTLVIWTAPPGDAVLEEVLRRVNPRQVVWVCRDPQETSGQAFITRLAGMVKYALHAYAGRFSVAKLAAATGQRDETVLAALELLCGRGWITIVESADAEWRVEAGAAPDAEIERLASARLRELLAETAAYRTFLHRADLDAIDAPPEPQTGGSARRKSKVS